MKRFCDLFAALKEQIRHLPPDLKRRVWEAIDLLAQRSDLGKPLTDELEGYRSYRIGRYRLIYRIESDRIVFIAFGSRRDIYERIILEIGRQKIREREAKYAASHKQKRADSAPKRTRKR